MNSVWKDLSYASRSLMRNPALSLTILLSMALAIGVNSAVFSVFNEILLNPLPYKDSERIVWLHEMPSTVSYENVESFSDALVQGPFFEEIAGHRQQSFWITNQTWPEKVIGIRVSRNTLHLLGIQPVLGRYFLKEEDRIGAPLVIMLSYDCWKKRFSGDPNVLGKNIRVDGVAATIVGVLPKFPNTILLGEEIWLPMSALHDHKLKKFRTVYLMGKLKSGISVRQAQDWANSVARNMGADKDHKFELQTIRDMKYEIESESLPALGVWIGASAFILLITCANVVSLLLARSTSRQKEFAIRLSLGASRFEIIRLQLMESLMLSILGGLAGFIIAFWAADLFRNASENPQPWFAPFFQISTDINWMVVLFTAGISVIAGIASGIFPAIQFTKKDFNSSLMRTSQHLSADRPRRRLANIFIVIELSLTVILITGAGLLIKGLLLVTNVDPGFRTRNIVMMDLQMPSYKWNEPFSAQAEAFFHNLLDRLRNISQVESASAALWPPSEGSSSGMFALDNSSDEWMDTGYQLVAPDYFQTLGIGLVQGRFIGNEDRANTPLVVVVSESFAKKFFPGQSALGKRIRFDEGGLIEGIKEIVGVVRDVYQSGLDEQKEPLIYVPFTQSSIYWRQIFVRSTIPVGTISDLMRKHVREIDPDMPVGPIKTMDQVFSNSFVLRRLKTLLLTSLGITGLLISIIGIYGLVSYSVESRIHELGIRMAIGAQKWDILKLVTSQGAFLAIAGLVIGVVCSVALNRFLSGFIYGMSPIAPEIFLIVCLIFLTAAILASYFPAKRATRVDPVVALRQE